MKILCALLIAVFAMYGFSTMGIFLPGLIGWAVVAYTVGLYINWKWSTHPDAFTLRLLLLVTGYHIASSLLLLGLITSQYQQNMFMAHVLFVLIIKIIISLIIWSFLGMPWRRENAVTTEAVRRQEGKIP